MKLFKCINNNPGYWLTPGKIYMIKLNFGSSKHLIVNDKGREHYIFEDELKESFIDIRIVRENQLTKLGI